MKKIAFWLCLTLVLLLSLLPTDMLPPQAFNLWDKAQHALGFALLSALGFSAYPDLRRVWLGYGLLGAGGFIELAQAATGWRHGDWLDLIANGVGIAVASVLWRPGRRPA